MTSHRADVQRRKRELRREYRDARTNLSTGEREYASERIAEKVIHAAFFQRSRLVGCYLSLSDEVDTWRIIARAWRMKKRIFAPVTRRNRMLEFREVTPESDLVRDDYGLLMPRSGDVIAARKLDLVLTPLVAFDERGQRIGMGGGYYDRTFSFLRGRRQLLKPKLVGLAFACQQAPEIASNPWDIRLYRVITESS
ncbi:MAG: 5-formyltetrahydrofolate cyclo-ligase [Woeseia sp.]